MQFLNSHLSFDAVRGSRWSPLAAICSLVLGLGMLGQSTSATAQEVKENPVEELVLVAKDGMELTASYYTPKQQTVDTTPVLLLHGFEGSRADFHPLALVLQQAGYAVLVPDLRGHGDSKSVRNQDITVTADRLRGEQFARMISQDVEACKRYLIDRNNDKKCNIDKLCIVGAEMGAIIAVNYAMLDWSFPTLPTGKQGQDVKVLILLSPEWTFKNLNCTNAMRHPAVAKTIAAYVLVGKKSSASLRDANRVHQAMERYRSDSDEPNLFYARVDTSLQGAKMLTIADLDLNNLISKFIEVHAAKKAAYPWAERVNPND